MERIEAFKLYSEMAKQVLTLASALLVAIIGAVKAFGAAFQIDFALGGAIISLMMSLAGGLTLLGALTENLQGARGIDAAEIVWSARFQLLFFFLACIFLGVFAI